MRNAIATAFLLFISLFGVIQGANASVTAENIFATMGGTTTVDRGGAIHSQARSIYSLGGGMASFKGKRVSLMAADPPSFSSGCAGISWHFGGFAFISVDEIRQLVEAVAQASLGVAVDLAMQTLCPQCYAVMAKLRDIANQMRNAAADSCKIARGFGGMLQSAGVFSSAERVTDCSQIKSEAGVDSSPLAAMTSGACKLLSGAETAMKEYGDNIEKWASGGNAAVSKTPSKDMTDKVGNMTYEALDNLGYPDGFVKDFILSYTGMVIFPPVGREDCSKTLVEMFGSPKPSAADLATPQDAAMDAILTNHDTRAVTATSADGRPRASDAQTVAAKTEATHTTTARTACYAPPIVSGIQYLGLKLICGFDAYADMKIFAQTYGLSVDKLANSSVGAMCNVKTLSSLSKPYYAGDEALMMYQCDKVNTSSCMKPKLVSLETAIGAASSNGQYTGLAWYILDALYSGVAGVMTNDASKMGPALKIINGSDYPLYRMLNMAAVYPGLAGDRLDAWGSVIATHYALDTLDVLMRPGSNPQISMKASKSGMPFQEVAHMRSDIMEQLINEAGSQRSQIQKRLAEKQALVETILQMNKAIQAEIMSKGLAGNADLAVSLKQQATKTTP